MDSDNCSQCGIDMQAVGGCKYVIIINTGNRDVKKAHVNNLVSSMQEELLMNVLIVNENDIVIDGQNRLV